MNIATWRMLHTLKFVGLIKLLMNIHTTLFHPIPGKSYLKQYKLTYENKLSDDIHTVTRIYFKMRLIRAPLL